MPTTTRSITPNLDELVTAGLAKLYELRPRAQAHTDYRTGRYWHPFVGWQAQAALVASRLGDEIGSARLRIAEGESLRRLASSEFVQDAIVDTPTRATGKLTLARTGALPYGVIRAGTVFRRSANPSATPIPLTSAEYEVTSPVVVAQGQATATVPVKAVRDGADANVVLFGTTNPTDIAVSGLFDKLFTLSASECAGGAKGYDDLAVQRMAKATYTGQFGPTATAIVGGAYRQAGARNIGVIDAVDLAATAVYPADSSWGSSQALTDLVVQYLADNVQGFGCKVVGGLVRNLEVRLELVVTLRSTRHLNGVEALSSKIFVAARSYFDDRVDWFSWKANAVRAIVSGLDPKILKCTSAILKKTDGSVVADNTVTLTSYVPYLTHYYLASTAIQITFQGP